MEETLTRHGPDHHHHASPREMMRNVNLLIEQHSSAGQRIADRVTRTVGSWRFIITQSCILVIWLILNVLSWIQHWDPYPFILLNLVLSFQAAYTAPIIMMSQNRQSLKDRLQADEDYRVNRQAEQEIANLNAKIDVLLDCLSTHFPDVVPPGARQSSGLISSAGQGVVPPIPESDGSRNGPCGE